MTILEFNDYRNYLKSVLVEKTKINSSYSLRSFSKSLGLSPSHLSRVLAGQKKLSPTMASQIAQRLRFSKAEQSHFNLMVQLELTKDEGLKEELYKRAALETPSSQQALGMDRFKVIADWQHFAILSLVKTKSFKSDPTWIAKRLCISPLEASLAIDRLISVELLEKSPRGTLRLTEGNNVTTTDGIASSAIKQNHRQQMKRAEEALTQLPMELRDFNNLAITMKPKDMLKAQKMIREFLDRFNDEMDSSEGTELFQLNIQYFQSTNLKKESL